MVKYAKEMADKRISNIDIEKKSLVEVEVKNKVI
jgi:hypothetical protein